VFFALKLVNFEKEPEHVSTKPMRTTLPENKKKRRQTSWTQLLRPTTQKTNPAKTVPTKTTTKTWTGQSEEECLTTTTKKRSTRSSHLETF
jgi:hypothetical protein